MTSRTRRDATREALVGFEDRVCERTSRVDPKTHRRYTFETALSLETEALEATLGHKPDQTLLGDATASASRAYVKKLTAEDPYRA